MISPRKHEGSDHSGDLGNPTADDTCGSETLLSSSGCGVVRPGPSLTVTWPSIEIRSREASTAEPVHRKRVAPTLLLDKWLFQSDLGAGHPARGVRCLPPARFPAPGRANHLIPL